MAAYMQDQFVFLGVQAGPRRIIQKQYVAAGRDASEEELLEFARECWSQPERELQYVATDMLRKWNAALTPAALPALEALVVSRSWWDTVDALAAWSIGPLVGRHSELTSEMDRWIDEDNFWLARSAIIHQLGFKERTDSDRLFDYVERRAADREFFIRKASGWALRQYARVDADAVRAFVEAHPELPPLTRREALKRLS